jgi:hypothetical protein
VRERDARKRRNTGQLNGASAAMTFTARHLRTGETELFTQDLCERAADRDVEGVGLAVDTELRQASSPPRCRPGG